MPPQLIVLGSLSREFILPLNNRPLLDVPGGSALYAAVGAAVWTQGIGLVGRVGEDYPQAWLRRFEALGLDVRGVRILPQPLDVRSFRAWLDEQTCYHDRPIIHFARLGLPFPQALLGYQDPAGPAEKQTTVPLASPRPADIPPDYRTATAVHICPLDITSVGRLQVAFQESGVSFLTLAAPRLPPATSSWEALQPFLRLTAFLPAERTLRALFRGQTEDLWEMAEAIASWGCTFIAVQREKGGQILYEAAARRRWEVPPYPARAVDPGGADEAFCGGFLAGLLQTGDPLEAVLRGNVSASLAVEGGGALYALEATPGLEQARLECLRELARRC